MAAGDAALVNDASFNKINSTSFEYRISCKSKFITADTEAYGNKNNNDEPLAKSRHK